jgi:hypothetical protein
VDLVLAGRNDRARRASSIKAGNKSKLIKINWGTGENSRASAHFLLKKELMV